MRKLLIFSIQGVKELLEWAQGGFVVDFSKTTDGAIKS